MLRYIIVLQVIYFVNVDKKEMFTLPFFFNVYVSLERVGRYSLQLVIANIIPKQFLIERTFYQVVLVNT